MASAGLDFLASALAWPRGQAVGLCFGVEGRNRSHNVKAEVEDNATRFIHERNERHSALFGRYSFPVRAIQNVLITLLV